MQLSEILQFKQWLESNNIPKATVDQICSDLEFVDVVNNLKKHGIKSMTVFVNETGQSQCSLEDRATNGCSIDMSHLPAESLKKIMFRKRMVTMP